MGNQNQKTGQKTGEQEMEQNVQQQAEQPVVQQQAATEEQPKTGFKAWLKKHWKGVTAAAVGTVAAAGSAFAAYKKGKAAGIMSVPVQQQEQEDYSLNPNE